MLAEIGCKTLVSKSPPQQVLSTLLVTLQLCHSQLNALASFLCPETLANDDRQTMAYRVRQCN